MITIHNKTLRLEQANFCNAKLYWKMLKESANVKVSSTIILSIRRHWIMLLEIIYGSN